MNTSGKNARLNLIMLSILALGSLQAYAEDETVEQLTSPESSISVGAGNASGEDKDRTIFGQYNGLRKDNNTLQLDFLINRRDEYGLWTQAEGRNLGLDNREVTFSQNKQGDWRYAIGYSEITKHDIRTINTGLQGAGTATPVVNLLATPGSGNDINLEIRRKNFSISVEKWLSDDLQFQGDVKNESKDGARIFGKGFACSAAWVTAGLCTASTTQWVLLMLPEVINTNTRQFDAKLNYSGDAFMISGGYYGSFFANNNPLLSPTVPSTLNNPVGTPTALDAGLQAAMAQPVALPPDNQAHQLFVDGNYAFTPSTRATFKYSWSRAIQNMDFASTGLSGAPAGISSLDGVVDNRLAQVGLTSTPVSKLSLSANFRTEDKRDSTPVTYYNVEGDPAVQANYFTNGLTSSRKTAGKLEAAYRLPANFRIKAGMDYNAIDRGNPDSSNRIAGLSALRAKNEETGYRAEISRTMSDSVNATLSYATSKRTGGDWYSLSTAVNATSTAICGGACYGHMLTADQVLALSSTSIFPMTMADRERDKTRLMLTWDAMDNLSLQFGLEGGADKYTSGATRGLQDNKTNMYSIDAVYTFGENWKLTGYMAESHQMMDVSHSTGYIAALEDVSTSFGLALDGKASSKVDVGANLDFLNDRNRYGIDNPSGANANNVNQVASYDIPDVTFRQVTLKVYGKYALQKNAEVRLNYLRQVNLLDEWSWGYNGVSFAYSDNTTVGMRQNQDVSFIGLSYILKM